MPLLSTRILEIEGFIVCPVYNTHSNPKEFFFNSSNIDCRETFRKRVLPVLKPIANISRLIFGVARLKKKAYDCEIRADLPIHHTIEWEGIASLIKTYPDGIAVEYLLCYLKGVGEEVFLMTIHEPSGHHRKWHIADRRFDEQGEDNKWSKGCHIFFPVGTFK